MSEWYFYTLVRKFPLFSPAWEPAVQEAWWRCYNALNELVPTVRRAEIFPKRRNITHAYEIEMDVSD